MMAVTLICLVSICESTRPLLRYRVTVQGRRYYKSTAIEPVGSYAVRLCFDDGHDTGLFSWPVLYRLGSNQTHLWQTYLERLEQAGQQREKQPLNEA